MNLMWKYLCNFVRWKIIKLKFHINDNNILIALPDENRELDNCVLLHLKEYVAKKYAKSVVIVARDELDNKLLQGKEYIKKVICSDDKLINKIIDLQPWADHLNLISLENPEGSMNENLIGVSNLNLEDIVCYCNLELFEFEYKMGV